VRGYPALIDDGDSVSLRTLTDPDLAERAHRLGVRRLLMLTVPVGARAATAHISHRDQLVVAANPTFGWRELIADCTLAAATSIIDRHGAPRTSAEFDALRDAVGVIAVAADVAARLDRLGAASLADSVGDARDHLHRLVRPGFVTVCGVERLADVQRYVRAIERRLVKLPDDPTRDQRAMAEVRRLEDTYRARLDAYGRRPLPSDMRELAWQLEEVRVSQFAQALAKKGAPSLSKVAAALARS
jgi:ATP-dependent helicase HrpA